MGPFIPHKYKPPTEPTPPPVFDSEWGRRWRERYDRGACPCGCGLSLTTLRSVQPATLRLYEQTGDWNYARATANEDEAD